MDSSSSSNHARASPTPPTKAEAMAASSRTSRGSTPTASRSASRLVKAESSADRPARAASSNSLKQKMAAKGDDQPRPTRADEVRSRTATLHLHASSSTTQRGANAAQQLKTLQTEFDSLRSHLTCKVCDRLLYQPYTIACGHTYCYTVRRSTWHLAALHRRTAAPWTRLADSMQCLCTWFLNLKQNRSKLTCPDCRVDVKHLPAPAYVVSRTSSQHTSAI